MKKKSSTHLPKGMYRRGEAIYLRYTDTDGKYVRKRANSNVVSEALAELESLRDGAHIPSRRTVQECFDMTRNRVAMEGVGKTPSHYNIVLRIWENAIDTSIHLPIVPPERGLFREKIAGVLAGWHKNGKAPATIVNYHAILSGAMNRAVDWGWMPENPVNKMKMSRVQNARVRFATPQEEKLLLKACSKGSQRRAIRFAILTGLRYFEQMGLRREDINWDTQMMTIRGKGGKIRHLPITEESAVILRAQFKLGWNPIFKFKPYLFSRISKRSGVDSFRWHDLRHTFASRLAMQGVSIYQISTLMGHSNIATTQRYAHLHTPDLRSVMGTLTQIGTPWGESLSESQEEIEIVKLDPRYVQPALELEGVDPAVNV